MFLCNTARRVQGIDGLLCKNKYFMFELLINVAVVRRIEEDEEIPGVYNG